MTQIIIFSATDQDLQDATASVERGVNEWLQALSDPANQTKPVQVLSMHATHVVEPGIHHYTIAIHYA